MKLQIAFDMLAVFVIVSSRFAQAVLQLCRPHTNTFRFKIKNRDKKIEMPDKPT